ncbi:MAG: OmpA family protein [Cyclobacteriaceae bacterium]
MKYLHTIFFLLLMAALVSWKQEERKGMSPRLYRAKMKAEKSYHSLAFVKSIKRYKKVLELKPNEFIATLRIADSYRMINDMVNAGKWYEKAAEAGELTDKQDQLNFAQVLSSLGRYEEADKWYRLHGENGEMSEVVKNKRMAIDRLTNYYRDSIAYFVEETGYNSTQSDFGPAYTANGIVFASARSSNGLLKPKYSWDDSFFLDIYSVSEGGKPEKVQTGINTRYHEGPAVFFDNDSKVIFTRNNFHKGKAGQSEDGINKLKLFYTEKAASDNSWSDPVALPFNSDNYSVGHPTISSDGKTLYFASDMPGGYGGSDIYKSEWSNGNWGTPRNMGDVINTAGDELFPFIHNDETLFYSSNGMPGIGGLDVFEVSVLQSQTPRNVGFPINTSKDDFGMIMSEDGRTGYLSSNREGGTGKDDIYRFEKYFYDVKVRLVHAETGQPIEGHISSDFGKGAEVAENETEMTFSVLKGQQLQMVGAKPGFEEYTKTLNTLKLPKELKETYLVELPLKPIEKEIIRDIILVRNNGINSQIFSVDESPEEFPGDLETLKAKFNKEDVIIGEVYEYRNIYYDFDRFHIRQDAALELDQVAGLLKKYPDVMIELSAHTDVRGTNRYNDILSENRSKSAMTYLVNKGIAADRILIRSYGEESLFVNCNTRCDEEKHQSNRRTEIKLITRSN